MWFFKKCIDVYYIILFEWFDVFFVSSIFNRMVIILIYLLQKNTWIYPINPPPPPQVPKYVLISQRNF